MPALTRVPTHVNGHVITEPERQLHRLLLAGESTARSARLMGLSRGEVTALARSLRQKGLRPGAALTRRAPATRVARTARRGRATALDSAGRKRFGAHLRSLRTSRGMTQASLAGDAFTAAFVSMVESGVAAPSLKSIVHFARALGVSVREVIPPDF